MVPVAIGVFHIPAVAGEAFAVGTHTVKAYGATSVTIEHISVLILLIETVFVVSRLPALLYFALVLVSAKVRVTITGVLTAVKTTLPIGTVLVINFIVGFNGEDSRASSCARRRTR